MSDAWVVAVEQYRTAQRNMSEALTALGTDSSETQFIEDYTDLAWTYFSDGTDTNLEIHKDGAVVAHKSSFWGDFFREDRGDHVLFSGAQEMFLVRADKEVPVVTEHEYLNTPWSLTRQADYPHIWELTGDEGESLMFSVDPLPSTTTGDTRTFTRGVWSVKVSVSCEVAVHRNEAR